MSGHSKWHNIQARKGKQDVRRANAFTKIGRMITIATRESGADVTTNFALRIAIQKAREVNMPKDTIDKAIKRGTGEINDGAQLEEMVYEGFGPGGVAFLIDAVTDNKNRTAGELKAAFNKCGGSLAGPGSVQWQFEKKGVVRFTAEKKKAVQNWEALELALMDAGVDNMSEQEGGTEVFCPVDKFHLLMQACETHNIEPDESGLEWIAKETVSHDGVSTDTLYNMLDELDDVKAVYTNQA